MVFCAGFAQITENFAVCYKVFTVFISILRKKIYLCTYNNY